MASFARLPCTPSQRVYPARLSVWEIHPVYGIDVCKSKDFSAQKLKDLYKVIRPGTY